MDEWSLIREYFCFDDAAGLEVDNGDDAAVVTLSPGHSLVVATDTLVEGIHFPSDFPAERIAQRLVAVNVSDIFAMAATPRWVLLNLTLPKVEETWLAAFASGLQRALHRYGCRLIGGDTSATTAGSPIVLSLQCLGEVKTGAAKKRDAAQAGDDIYITGPVGGSWLGLQQWQRGMRSSAAIDAYTVAAIDTAPLANAHAMHALIDTSDGVLQSVALMLSASSARQGVTLSAKLDLQALPLFPGIADADVMMVLRESDDYRMVFTASAASRVLWASVAGVSRIGTVQASGPAAIILQAEGKADETIPLAGAPLGYTHFRS